MRDEIRRVAEQAVLAVSEQVSHRPRPHLPGRRRESRAPRVAGYRPMCRPRQYRREMRSD